MAIKETSTKKKHGLSRWWGEGMTSRVIRGERMSNWPMYSEGACRGDILRHHCQKGQSWEKR